SVLWQAKSMNVAGQVTDEQAGNGLETVSNRNSFTGWLLGTTATAHADGDNVIQQWKYGFDEAGNLHSRDRSEAAGGPRSTEIFEYDLLNRLRTATTTTAPGQGDSYTYDAIGNLTQKGGQ